MPLFLKTQAKIFILHELTSYIALQTNAYFCAKKLDSIFLLNIHAPHKTKFVASVKENQSNNPINTHLHSSSA